MNKVLIDSGWYMYKKCRCGGVSKEKFKNPSYPGKEYWLYPNRNIWEFRINRTVNNSNMGADTLKKHLEEL